MPVNLEPVGKGQDRVRDELGAVIVDHRDRLVAGPEQGRHLRAILAPERNVATVSAMHSRVQSSQRSAPGSGGDQSTGLTLGRATTSKNWKTEVLMNDNVVKRIAQRFTGCAQAWIVGIKKSMIN